MLYYEVARKHDSTGKLLPEMILVWCVRRARGERRQPGCHWRRRRRRLRCAVVGEAARARRLLPVPTQPSAAGNAQPRAPPHPPPTPLPPSSNALRNNLISPNEYIRGCTLRFLTKLREPELLESLIPSVKVCLSHRHPYVRRNAVLAVFTIFRAFPDLYPDATEDIAKFMEEETDAGTRRNAFVMMFNCATDAAITFLTKNAERVLLFGDGFALILLELIRKVVR